ncbi:MAG: hypothetical protein AB7U61_15005 [Methylocystis sp.]
MRRLEIPGSVKEREQRDIRSKIGKSFLLRRLALVSPDIPAGVVLLGRSNALHASLIRRRAARWRSRRAERAM